MTIDKTALATKPEAAIQQLNLGYNAEQDRLLLRVGLADNTELLVWLTYRITRQLWQLLNGETHLPTATSIKTEAVPQEAVAQFQQEMQVAETLHKMDFATEYQPRKEIVHNGAILATSLMLISVDNKPPTLEIPCLEGITVRMNLTQELILALCNMLQLSTKEAAWDIGASVPLQASTPILLDSETKKVLH
jgi:DNA polymerase III psi subunit